MDNEEEEDVQTQDLSSKPVDIRQTYHPILHTNDHKEQGEDGVSEL
jgi:hypothetical protein